MPWTPSRILYRTEKCSKPSFRFDFFWATCCIARCWFVSSYFPPTRSSKRRRSSWLLLCSPWTSRRGSIWWTRPASTSMKFSRTSWTNSPPRTIDHLNDGQCVRESARVLKASSLFSCQVISLHIPALACFVYADHPGEKRLKVWEKWLSFSQREGSPLPVHWLSQRTGAASIRGKQLN